MQKLNIVDTVKTHFYLTPSRTFEKLIRIVFCCILTVIMLMMIIKIYRINRFFFVRFVFDVLCLRQIRLVTATIEGDTGLCPFL